MGARSKGNPGKDVKPVFDTLAVLEKARKTPAAGVTVPSKDAVERAKDWVDENEL